jgi:CBS domain-containing protein
MTTNAQDRLEAPMTHDYARVGDCMHAGIFSCSPDTPVAEVAKMMGEHHVHAIAVPEVGHGRPWGTWAIVSDMDLMTAVAGGGLATARQLAAAPSPTISADEHLGSAAQMMGDHGVAHLVVVDSAGGYPVGIISTLDIAAAFGA